MLILSCASATGITDSEGQSTSLYVTVAPGVAGDFTFITDISTPQKSKAGKQLLSCSAFSDQVVNGRAAFL